MERYTGMEEDAAKSTSMTGKELLKSLIPSFLSLDTDGRVVRLDSLSKVLAPGIRLGPPPPPPPPPPPLPPPPLLPPTFTSPPLSPLFAPLQIHTHYIHTPP